MVSPKHKRLAQTTCKYRLFVWYVVIITVWLLAARKVICCYGLVIGSAVSVLSVVTVWLLAVR
jgi:hypothetical protein